jgi:hypothetical protein
MIPEISILIPRKFPKEGVPRMISSSNPGTIGTPVALRMAQ